MKPAPATGLIAAWAVVTLAARYAIDPLAAQHDQAINIQWGVRILQGQLSYVDFFDTQPPLIQYLNVPVAWAARALHVNPIPVFTAAITLLAAWAAWMTMRITRAMPEATLLDRLVLLSIPLGPCALNPAASNIGQREHLFLLFYLPLMMLRICRAEKWAPPRAATAFLIGLLAGPGIALKPHFLLPVAAVEAVLLWRTRSWRSLAAPEFAGLAAFFAIYACHVLLLPAAMRDGFFNRLVPMVRSGYAAYNSPEPWLMTSLLRRTVIVAAAGMLAAAFGERRMTRAFLPPAAAFAAASLAIAAVQLKGWRYHYLPIDATIVFFAAMALAGIGRRAPALTAAVMVAGLAVWPALNQRDTSAFYRFRDLVSRYVTAGEPVGVLSTKVDFAFPAVLQTGNPVVNGHPWTGMLMLSLYAQSHGAPWAADEERRVADETADDLERGQPAAIFVERHPGCMGCPPGFTMLDWCLRQPRLAAILATYRYRGLEGDAAVFTR